MTARRKGTPRPTPSPISLGVLSFEEDFFAGVLEALEALAPPVVDVASEVLVDAEGLIT